MSLQTGKTFERYRIEAVLGEGGMGTVYRAYDTRLQRIVALKVLRPRVSDLGQGGSYGSGSGTSGGIARVLREARAAAALDHPCAVVIHDVGEHEGTAYIAMEHVEGKSLRAYVTASRDEVDVATRMRWLKDVARVLAAAHDKGLIHRDVKPENVMIRPDGRVKVLDFGIARRVRNDVDPAGPTLDSTDEGAQTNTGDAVVMGTPAYMAPEQVRNETLDARADQFSWAVMAYELLTGKIPWRPRDQLAIVASIVTDEPVPLSTVAPELGATIAHVIARALSKPREQRFPSMDALLAALEEPLSAQAPTRGRPARSRAALHAALVVGALAAVTVIAVRARRRPPTTPPPLASASVTPRTIVDHPDPRGCSAPALVHYREGLRALRQVGWDAAQRAFEKTIETDASCAAAHLRLSLMGPGLSMASARVRATYQAALRLSAELEPRERDLLEAAEPCIARDPPDRAECSKRVLPLAQKYPNDAEMLVWVADFASKTSVDHEALLKRAVQIDPGYADAWQELALSRMRANDPAGASDALDRCIASAPASNDCRFERVRIEFRRAECKAAEKHARDWVVRTPGQAFPQMFLANALAAQGEPRDVVEEALRARWMVLEAEFKDFVTLLEKAQVAAYYGDFGEARVHADELLKMAEGSDYARHAEASLFAARLAEEEGRKPDVVKLASAFRRGARVWPYPTVYTPYTWHSTPEAAPSLLRLEGEAGGITANQLATAIREWRDDAIATQRVSALQAFAYGPASLADALEAGKAVSSAPLPIVPLRLDADGALLRGTIGRLLQRAGRGEDALAYLRAAANDCGPLLDAFDAVRAHLWLGEVLEARGDESGACAEYRAVFERWGKARSVTAERARSRSKTLACPG